MVLAAKKVVINTLVMRATSPDTHVKTPVKAPAPMAAPPALPARHPPTKEAA